MFDRSTICTLTLMLLSATGVPVGAQQPLSQEKPQVFKASMGKSAKWWQDFDTHFSHQDVAYHSNISPQQSKWFEEVATIPFTSNPVSGKLDGIPFVAQNVYTNEMKLQDGKNITEFYFCDGHDYMHSKVGVFMFLQETLKSLQGKSFLVIKGQKSSLSGCINLKPQVGMDYSYASPNLISMRIQFGNIENGRLPGYLIMRFPDWRQSNLQGYFYAGIKP